MLLLLLVYAVTFCRKDGLLLCLRRFRVSLLFTLDAGLLARSQYPEGPTTGHLDTGFSWFPFA